MEAPTGRQGAKASVTHWSLYQHTIWLEQKQGNAATVKQSFQQRHLNLLQLATTVLLVANYLKYFNTKTTAAALLTRWRDGVILPVLELVHQGGHQTHGSARTRATHS
jgi:hypothetical protein